MSIYLCGTLFVMIRLGMNPFINAQGFERIGMMIVPLGVVVNIALDLIQPPGKADFPDGRVAFPPKKLDFFPAAE